MGTAYPATIISTAVGDPRFSTAAARLLRVFLAGPARPRYGLELMTAAELPSLVLYPLLAQLERSQWIEGAWEPADPLARSRPPRRYYRLTTSGHQAAVGTFTALGVRPEPPPQSRPLEPCGACLVLCPMAMAALALARARLPASHRDGVYAEWRAELEHILRCGTASVPRRMFNGFRYARGLVAAAARIARDLGPCRTEPPIDPLVLSGAHRRLLAAERAWDAAARRHETIDAARDPVAEFLALHTVLFCQLEVDEAQLAYRTARAIAAFGQETARG
jgi:hypothetical protein